MDTKEAIRRAGNQRKLGAMFGVTRSAVNQWGDRLPELRELQLRRMKPHWFRKSRAHTV